MRYLFIVNPVAGGGRAQAVWHQLATRVQREAERLGHEAEVAFTSAPGHATALARDHCRRADMLVGVGGDGTLNEIAAGMVEAQIDRGPVAALGVIPSGTGNDFVRTLGIPRAPEAALAVCWSGHRLAIDLGVVNGRPFINVAGTGFDARVAQDINQRARPGRATGPLPYLISVVRVLATYRNSPLTLTLDSHERHLVSMLVAVGNARAYGGGLRICPQAELADGLLDVCLVGNLSRAATIFNLARVFRGTHLKHPLCDYQRAREVTIAGPPDLPVHADGQIIGTLPAHFSIMPQALTVAVPIPHRLA